MWSSHGSARAGGAVVPSRSPHGCRAGRAAIRNLDRAVTDDDYRDIVARRFADVRVLDVGASRIGPAGSRRDGVRVTIIPRRFSEPADLLARIAVIAPEIERVLARRAVMGVAVRVGPPVVILPEQPPLDDPLSLSGGSILVLDDGRAAVRSQPLAGVDSEGIFWPPMTPAQLRNLAAEDS